MMESITTKVVLVGMQFDRIGEIDTMNEKYQAEVTIEATWEEDKLIDKYNEATDWNPNLYIENIIQETKRTIKFKIEKNYEKNTTKITQILNIKGVFWERLEIQNFPIDIQELSVIVTTSKGVNEIKLKEDRSKHFFNERVTKTFVDQQKWKLYNFIEVTYQASYDTESSNSAMDMNDLADAPKICAKCFVSRQPQYYYWNAYFLIFLITISSFNVFAIDCKVPQGRLQSTFTLLLTSISFKWVINRSLPTVSYLTSLDIYAIANIFFLCLVSLWHSIVATFWEATFARELDRWLLLAYGVLFILIQISLSIRLIIPYVAINRLKKKERKFVRMLHYVSEDMKNVTSKVTENSKL